MLSGTRDLNDDLELSRLKEELLAAEREHGPESASLIEPLEKLAYRYHSLGLQAEAEDTYKRVLSLREANAEQDINGLISTLHCLAILMRIQSRFAEAEPYYARALELTRQQCGPNHMETATRQNYLAGLYFAWQKFDLAEELVLSSLSIYKENLGEQHELVGIASMGLALICNRQSRIPEANEYFRRASRILPAAPHGSVLLNFRDLAASLLFLSKEKYKQGQIEGAEILFRYALIVETDRLWPGHRTVADSVQLLGDLYRSQRMNTEAEFLYRRALDIRRRMMGPQHLDVAVSANSLGTLLADNRRYDEAAEALKEAVDIRAQAGFPPLLANSLRAYAAVLRQLSRSAEAEDCDKRAHQIFEKYNPT